MEDEDEDFFNAYRNVIYNINVQHAEDHPIKKPHELYVGVEIGSRDGGEV